MDDYNREVLAIEIDTSLPAERVVRVLEQTTSWRGQPKRIRVDNGPEFISSKLGLWCEEKGIALQFIQPFFSTCGDSNFFVIRVLDLR